MTKEEINQIARAVADILKEELYEAPIKSLKVRKSRDAELRKLAEARFARTKARLNNKKAA